MNEYNARVLAARIDHALEEGPSCGGKISKRLLLEGSKNDLATLKHCIHEWKTRGLLKVLRDIDECDLEDQPLEMLSFIGQKSPIKGWLNWE